MPGRPVLARLRSFRLTRRGWAVLVVAGAILAAAIVFDRREGFVVTVFLVSLLVVAGVFVTARRARVEVSRRPSSELLAVGEEARITLAVRTDSWDPTITRWRDSIPASFGSAPEGTADSLVRSGVAGLARTAYAVRPERRGDHVLGPLVVVREDPFGLVEMERASRGTGSVVVTPRVSPLVRSELLQASGEGARHEHRMSSHPRVDELIAREYRTGDPLRRIHWRATARRGELMVRQEEQEVDPVALLLLDTATTPDGSTLVPDAVFERMVDLTASIAVHILDAGFRLTLVESVPAESGAPERFEPSQGSDVLRRLAVVAPTRRTQDAPDIAVVGRELLDRAGAPVPFIVVLADASTATARRLSSLGRLADPAIAFVPVDSVSGEGADALRSAGWIVGAVDAARDVADLWNVTVLVERGRPVEVR